MRACTLDDFEYEDVQSDYFDLWANGVFFGYYEYADLPITIPNSDGETTTTRIRSAIMTILGAAESRNLHLRNAAISMIAQLQKCQ